jgi:hypothetical protein
MKVDMDKIIFESRREIEAIAVALQTTSSSDEQPYVDELLDLLEVMYLSW